LGPHDENDDFEDTCAGMGEFMESEIETNLTFLKDITPDESSFENLEKDDPISPLEDDIGDYSTLKRRSGKSLVLNFTVLPFMTLIRRMRLRVALPFSHALFMRIHPSIPSGRRIIIFLCVKSSNWRRLTLLFGNALSLETTMI